MLKNMGLHMQQKKYSTNRRLSTFKDWSTKKMGKSKQNSKAIYPHYYVTGEFLLLGCSVASKLYHLQ